MHLAPGTRIGVYEVVALMGAGGMGEVYRARDPRLGREVAIKILPAGFSADSDRLRRFEQEARAAAALNHPNILAVFDIGSNESAPYVVSELLEGETLRERLQNGPIPPRKVIEYTIQIAHGLAAAHDKGIVHRDLKPDNIFVTADGRIKILDFGLAKLTQSDSPLVAGTNVPTSPVPNQTQAGLVLGTIGYMAPEQVRGQTVDHRADIFAFGGILYEMLSGQRAFTGETTIDTMTAILKGDPPDLPVAERQIPPALARIVDRCIEKTPAARFQSAGDLAFALEALSSYSERFEIAPTKAAAPPHTPRRDLNWMMTTVWGTAVVAALALGRLGYLQPAPSATPVYRSSLIAPAGTLLSDNSPSRRFALSPDGRRLAFTAAGPDGRVMLWVRPLDGLGAQALAGTEDAVAPFWSPDSRFIGFFAGLGAGKLKKIAAAGGPPTTLCEFGGSPAGASWNREDVILFTGTGEGGGPIRRVSAMGGSVTTVLTPDKSQQEGEYFWPFFLSDSRHFLYLALNGRRPLGIYAAALDSTERKLLVTGGSNAKVANGYLLFMRDQTLLAQKFDERRLELSGEAVPIADQLQTLPPTGAFAGSDNGILAFQAGAANVGSQLVWVDRAGKQSAPLGDMAPYGDVQLSPDGSRVAVSILDPPTGTRDIWIYDVGRGLRSRFTFDPANEFAPVWSPDGSRVVFSRGTTAAGGTLFQKPASGAGAEEPLLKHTFDMSAEDFSRDGRFLLFRSGFNTPETGNDLWVMPQTGDPTPFVFLQTRFNELYGKFSPDGRWVAYISNESGRQEVYVTSFPKPTGKWQISSAGGTWPLWRGDGKEIYYVAPDSNIMAATVASSGPTFQPGAVRPLFLARLVNFQRYGYAASADGQRFLLNSTSEQITAAPITLVVNWPAALKK